MYSKLRSDVLLQKPESQHVLTQVKSNVCVHVCTCSCVCTRHAQMFVSRWVHMRVYRFVTLGVFFTFLLWILRWYLTLASGSLIWLGQLVSETLGIPTCHLLPPSRIRSLHWHSWLVWVLSMTWGSHVCMMTTIPADLLLQTHTNILVIRILNRRH